MMITFYRLTHEQLPSLVGSQAHDPRSSHNKNPAWQFGTHHASLTVDASPGPKHFPDVTYTRHGKDGTPHFSLYRSSRAHRTPHTAQNDYVIN